VSALVTGLDIVAEQLWIAAGRTLSAQVREAAAEATRPSRHAIEVRISAEDPAHEFAPAPGRITRWAEPTGAGIRVDSGVEQGTVVSPFYDPLLAKLLVVGADRDAALQLMRPALEGLEVGGVQTTVPFHRWLLGQDAFTKLTGLSTELVDRTWQPAPIVQPAALRAAELALSASIAAKPTVTGPDPAAAAWWRAGVEAEQESRL